MKYFNICIIALLFAFPANTFASSTNLIEKVAESTKTIKTKVKGVTCSSDLKTIANNVEGLEGVSSCKAVKSGPTSTFEITFDPAVVSEKQINAVIQNTSGCKNPNDRPYKVKQ
ncbi:heavy-metal-associated domain-containing protein [Persicobacter psychrovividus]|uniref:HMA domain-containing protein n=1 Tax=Persicobacter psychrovividus TaxID=387638 RepID=A0ABM7VF69_9BACT|nr:hypothetical protein PEPS_18610 [Persicobacter psychrovividus]